MKVLALVPPSKTGDRASRYSFLSEELAGFASRGIDVYCVSGHVSQRCKADGATVIPIPRARRVGHSLYSLRWLGGAPSGAGVTRRMSVARTTEVVARTLARESIDVIYSPFAWPAATAGLSAARKAGVPVVVSLRGADVLTEKGIGYGRMLDRREEETMRQTLKRVDRIIGVSRILIKRGIELGADPCMCTVILKGVDDARFSPGNVEQARRSLNLPERRTVLFVGNLIPRKGVAVLLRAMELVRQKFCDAQLVICGDGPDRRSLQDEARQLDLDDRVQFVGRVDRETVPTYFRACDVFVLPSLTEGSGNVLVEAAATGRPTVGTDVAGIPDYIEDGITGFLFRKGDAGDLAEKIWRVLCNPDLAARLGAAGRERVQRRHRMTDVVGQIEDVFRVVIAEYRVQQRHSVSPTAVAH